MDTRDWIIFIIHGRFIGTKTSIFFNTGEYGYCLLPRAYFTDRYFLNHHQDYGMDKSLQCKKSQCNYSFMPNFNGRTLNCHEFLFRVNESNYFYGSFNQYNKLPKQQYIGPQVNMVFSS